MPLLTDVRDILAEDTNTISNMYLTNDDNKKVGRMELRLVKMSSGREAFGLVKVRDAKV